MRTRTWPISTRSTRRCDVAQTKAGVERLLAALAALRDINRLHDLPPHEGDAVAWQPPARLYRLCWRWIVYDDQTIEVEELAQVPFHFTLLQARCADTLYVAVVKNHSAFYFDVLVRLDEAQAKSARLALARHDLVTLGHLANAC